MSMTKIELARPRILLVNTSGRVDFLGPAFPPEVMAVGTKCQLMFLIGITLVVFVNITSEHVNI